MATSLFLTSDPTYGGATITDAVGADIDESSSPSPLYSSTSFNVQKIITDRLIHTITISTRAVPTSGVAVGNSASLVLVGEDRDHGSGEGGTTQTYTYSNAVCTGIRRGLPINGESTASITFQAAPVAPA